MLISPGRESWGDRKLVRKAKKRTAKQVAKAYAKRARMRMIRKRKEKLRPTIREASLAARLRELGMSEQAKEQAFLQVREEIGRLHSGGPTRHKKALMTAKSAFDTAFLNSDDRGDWIDAARRAAKL